MLGPYWSTQLGLESGIEMRGKQVSRRTGEIGIGWENERGRCLIRGHTVLVAKGEIFL